MEKFGIIKFDKTYDQLEDIITSKLTHNEMELLDSIDSDKKLTILTYSGTEYGFIDREDDMVRFVYSGDEETLQSLLMLLSSCGLKLEFEDITNEVMMDILNVEEFFGNKVFNTIRLYMDEFISRNLDVDMVLDKISKYKISSLSVKDFSILEKRDITPYFSKMYGE